jgi:hypothetical protein
MIKWLPTEHEHKEGNVQITIDEYRQLLQIKSTLSLVATGYVFDEDEKTAWHEYANKDL